MFILIALQATDKQAAKHNRRHQHNQAQERKEDIMNQYKSMLANYSISNQRGSDSIDGIGSVSNSRTIVNDTEV